MSEKLIQFSQHQIDAFIVVLFVGLLASAIWMCCAYIRAQYWTEPIGRKYRVHLTFCVFQE
ncbi:Suppression of copper sensitivity: putative copper binding protein ScsA [Vibrio diabolicus E0666]|nr:Suppression of copper sensitivity: putative copper binding protein ScsA [Vibrio diabolicus E0666]